MRGLAIAISQSLRVIKGKLTNRAVSEALRSSLAERDSAKKSRKNGAKRILD